MRHVCQPLTARLLPLLISSLGLSTALKMLTRSTELERNAEKNMPSLQGDMEGHGIGFVEMRSTGCWAFTVFPMQPWLPTLMSTKAFTCPRVSPCILSFRSLALPHLFPILLLPSRPALVGRVFLPCGPREGAESRHRGRAPRRGAQSR